MAERFSGGGLRTDSEPRDPAYLRLPALSVNICPKQLLFISLGKTVEIRGWALTGFSRERDTSGASQVHTR